MSDWLEAKLQLETQKWSAKSYAQLAAMNYPVAFKIGEGAPDEYDVELTLLEKNEVYVHVSIAVSATLWTFLFPKASSVLVYATPGTPS